MLKEYLVLMLLFDHTYIFFIWDLHLLMVVWKYKLNVNHKNYPNWELDMLRSDSGAGMLFINKQSDVKFNLI